jgi:hypothetical protein
VVAAHCHTCHEAGFNGAPHIGVRGQWAPRLSYGLDARLRSAINGHGGMPARGGMTALTDSELRHAVIYMYSRNDNATRQPWPPVLQPASHGCAPATAQPPAGLKPVLAQQATVIRHDIAGHRIPDPVAVATRKPCA